MNAMPEFMLTTITKPLPRLPLTDYEAEQQRLEQAHRPAPFEPSPREIPPFVAGIFDDMPAATYHAIEAMSASGAKKMMQSPAHYHLMRTTENQPTPQMQFGTACHAGILEPDTFGDVVAQAPKFNKRSTAGKQEAEDFALEHFGKIILSPDDFDRCQRVIGAVRAHPAAMKLLQGAQIEKSIFWNDARYKVPCKMRCDALNFGGLIDLKTTTDASPDAFARTIAAYHYDLQAAFYFSGCEHMLNETPQFFVFIAVESEPPHGVGVYALGMPSISAGARHMDECLARYRDALIGGTWPGYPATISTIDTPAWARRIPD